MNLYLTATGRYVGTQAEARQDGKGWTPETVPTDKEGLIAYLNANAVDPRRLNAQLDSQQRVAFEPEADGIQIKPVFVEKLTQERVDEMFTPKPRASITSIANTTDFIRTLDGFAVGQILGAALDRAAELKEQHEEIFA